MPESIRNVKFIFSSIFPTSPLIGKQRPKELRKWRVNYESRSKFKMVGRRSISSPPPNLFKLSSSRSIQLRSTSGIRASSEALNKKIQSISTMTANLTSLRSSSSSDSEVDSCSKSCIKAYANLKEEYDSLTSNYKSQVSDKSKAGLGYKEITYDSFVNSSEILEKRENKSNKGYHEVPLPFTGNYMPLKCDLRLIDEHFESVSVDVISNIAPSDVKTVNHKGVSSKVKPKLVRMNNFSPPIIEDWHSDDESEEQISPTVKIVKPSIEKIKSVKTARETVENEESPKQHKHHPRGNQKNWNNLMFQRLEILTRSGKINTAGASVNTADRLVNTTGSKSTVNYPRLISKAFKRGHSHNTRPFNKFSANKSSVFNKKVNIVMVNDSTARKRAVVSRNMGREATTKVKKVNDQEQIQVLIDKKKVIITDDNIKSDLRFDDAEGTACLLNEWKFLTHTILQCISAKTTTWNEFSSTMASAIICLTDNQEFNFAKYIFDNMVKSLEGGVKFYLFPRFLQVFLDKQVEGMARHKEMYIISSHTKKIFTNMRRIGVGFSGVITPLFDTMMVQAAVDMGDTPVETHQTPIDEDHVNTPSSDPLPSGEDSITLNKLMVFYTNLQEQVLDLQEAKDAQAKEIATLKKKVKELYKWRKSRSGGLRRLKKIGSGRRIKSFMKKDNLGMTNNDEMLGVNDLDGKEVVMDTTTSEHEEQIIEDVSTVELVTTVGEVVTTTTVKDSAALTIAVATTVTTAVTTPRAKGIVFHEQKQSQIPIVSSSKDKGKAKMIEPKVPIKKKDHMRINEEYARKLEAEEQEAARLSRAQQDEEANIS
nr:hypothetical protein [Tanacetum cinerariifolium]